MKENTHTNLNTKLVVVTGGPGAGKTAVLEMAKKLLCKDAIIIPEAASIVFGGGFWRLQSLTAKASAQRAIFHVQREMENLVCEENRWKLGLCDRGTLDGLAYWPQEEKYFWEMSQSTLENELKKYYAVIHLRTPSDLFGYNHVNPLRIESSTQSHEIDEKIGSIWRQHPNYVEISSSADFLTKAQLALDKIAQFQKFCCKD